MLTVRADATKQTDIEAVVGETLSKWGQCDILVSNCGGPRPGTYQQLTPEDWEHGTQQTLMSVNEDVDLLL